MKIKLLVLTILLYFPSEHFARDLVFQTTIGNNQHTSTLQVNQENGTNRIQMNYFEPVRSEQHSLILNANYDVAQWNIRKKNGKEAFITRNTDDIIIKRTGHDDIIRKIDKCPFYSYIDFGVTGFYLSGKQKTDFWLINPDNYKTVKMCLTRMNIETVSHGNSRTEAQKIRISVAGMPAAFFSMYYWVRKTDGICLRFEGYQGGPGSKKIITELVKEQ